MKTFFISDTHFQHDRIIEYCHRPFSDVASMDETIVRNWNSVVSEDDIVFHLGDVGLKDREKLRTIIPNLHGKKMLICGNHDTRDDQFYRECGFSFVSRFPIIYKDFIVLSHEPLPFVMNQMHFSLYGHVHDSPLFQTKTENSCCVCVERWNYFPVEDKTIFGVSLDTLEKRDPMSYFNGDMREVIHKG